ncbi:MAG: hypothetical protein KDI69_06195 [Xanthomonadales bacterium]|jgi:hypothetical protein|nr:hypothetical protein [Xanthomonadales bacterium]
MTRTRRVKIGRVIAMLLLVGMAGLAFVWYLKGEREASTHASEKHDVVLDEPHLPEPDTPAVHDASAVSNWDGNRSKLEHTPLPDADVPLAQQLETLEALAEQGNPEAACRLYVGLRRCRTVAQRLQRAEQMQTHLEQGGEARISQDMMVSSIANTLENAQALSSWCEGIKPDHLPDANALAAGTIDRMTSAQKVLLVMSRQNGSLMRLPRGFGPPGGFGASSDFIYPQFLSERAYGILQDGIRRADPLALEGMLMVHSPSWLPGLEEFPRLSLPDRDLFVRYALLMREVYGDDALGQVAGAVLSRSTESMSPAERDAAQRWAEREAQRWRATRIEDNASAQSATTSAWEEEPGCGDR